MRRCYSGPCSGRLKGKSEFKVKNQSITCVVLKGVGTKKALCSCCDCIREAAILRQVDGRV